MTAAERQRRHRAKLEAKPRKRRWRVLPPEGEGECDYDPEAELALYAREPPAVAKAARKRAAVAQALEAYRLAQDYALLNPSTRPEEINTKRIREAKLAAAAWSGLVRQLMARRDWEREHPGQEYPAIAETAVETRSFP
jgi:hypothetical protein